MAKAKSDTQTFHLNAVSRGVIAACSVSTALVAPQVLAQDQLEEIIVTATKRAEGVQDIPMAITVLGQEQLTDLNITDMEDYMQILSNTSYISLGPGSGNIYIRGISSGGESGLGANPSVAVYLDEQPVTMVGAFLNPHIYDINRIELLAGPQGTTFGANAQSGAMRIITNQPDSSAWAAGFNVDGNQPKSGDIGYLAEGFLNAPISERAAVRVAAFYKRDAGYIDNVAGSYTFSNANIRAGLTDPNLIAIAQDITIDNNAIAKENFNEATTFGARAALRIDLNDAWTMTAGVMFQDLESDGVWDHDPTVGDLKVQRWMPDTNEDDWTQLSLTVEGEIFGGTLTGTFADLSRDQASASDYSLYSDYYVSYGFVQPYYSCYVSYFGACEDPRESLTSVNSYDRQNFELRFASDQENRFRWMIGAFYSDRADTSDNDWHVLGLANIPGAFVEGPDIYWTTNFNRTYEETAFFGEVSFDFTDKLSASVSTRVFDYEARLNGFSGTVFWPCGGWGPDHPDNNYGEDCADEDRLTEGDDTVSRVSVEYQFTDDFMAYATWGEGYRPGGLNRFCATRIPDGLGGQGENLASCDFRSDFLTSSEIGIKSTLLDGRMRLNAAVFWQDWDDFQFSRLDTSISPITLTYNVGSAESNGFEADFQVLLTDNWELNGAVSFLSAELASDYWRAPPDPADPNPPAPDAPSGTKLPRVPETKWNVASRYTWNNDWYVQGTYAYTGDSYNTLFDGGTIPTQRLTQDAYGVLHGAVGLAREDWSAELYVRNLTDERGDVWINAVNWDSRIMINRPRTIGVSYRRNF